MNIRKFDQSLSHNVFNCHFVVRHYVVHFCSGFNWQVVNGSTVSNIAHWPVLVDSRNTPLMDIWLLFHTQSLSRHHILNSYQCIFGHYVRLSCSLNCQVFVLHILYCLLNGRSRSVLSPYVSLYIAKLQFYSIFLNWLSVRITHIR